MRRSRKGVDLFIRSTEKAFFSQVSSMEPKVEYLDS